ncbi:hypothetical protein J2W32_004435 [Variovorax boronicumulans]|uniref:Uncharacterized protein n=1 Tax=Variovorax boronicumulans TaxID=436515 RepID=A0AAW8D2Q6_9BURK|nr:hypothetical protein [Variovorax boronicumulans]MDP9895337.1 hypothetical protein [Variovorax boronicumulans]MDQ0055377.1 hypothetical protein [Variovorax boronicumulans]
MNASMNIPELRPIIECALSMPAEDFEHEPAVLAVQLAIQLDAIGDGIPPSNREALARVAACLLMDWAEGEQGDGAGVLRTLLSSMETNFAAHSAKEHR